MRRGLSRRTFLRGATAGGAAVALGLPLLDAMTNLSGTAHADGTRFPTRFALWFWGNGTNPGQWAPATVGAGWTPTPLLSGLSDVADRVSIVSGTRLPVRGRNNPHVEGACGILTGTNPLVDPAFTSSSSDWDYMTVAGPSIDEVAAEVVGNPRHRSIVVSITQLHGVNGPGTAVRYTSHRGPYLYNDPVSDPARVFSMIFGGGLPAETGPTPEDLARASVLDAVLEDARSLDRRLGASDRERLEHHLGAVRDLERRLRAQGSERPAACVLPPMPLERASDRERASLMGDLIAMAFACDFTRVASMEFSSPASHAGYPDIFPDGLRHNGSSISFHEYEHNVGYSADTMRGLTYFVDVFGDFLRGLSRTPEGDGTLLDHSLVLGTSEVSGGENHTFDNFPLFIAGGANGALRQPGMHVRLSNANAARVPLTCLRALGSQAASWGADQFAASEPITELLVG